MTKLKSVSPSSQELFYRMVEKRPQKASIEKSKDYNAAEDRFIELAEEGNWRELKNFVETRSNAPVFLKASESREKLHQELMALGETLQEPTRKSKLVNKKVALAAAKDLRERILHYRGEHELFALHVAKITEYRVLTARAAAVTAVLREEEERNNGTFLTYEEETLGQLHVSGEYETDSPEWHAARAAGIGGSDVGAIMRSDSTYGSQNFIRVLDAKLGKINEIDDPLAQMRSDLTAAIGRGNAWEEYIRFEIQDRHPELRVAHCKSSWHGTAPYEYRHANFDGLFLDSNGVPEGVLEIKTGSNAKKWGQESEGFSSVPEGYRKQILWYAANAGLSYGKIVVLLSDYEYREYDFSLSDPVIQAELQEIYAATDDFWEDIQKRLAQAPDSSKIRGKYSALSPRESIDSVAEVLSSYSGLDKPQSKAKFLEEIAKAQGPEKRELSKSEFQAVVFRVFSKVDPALNPRPFVGIDIETTTTTPRTGRIIETGIVKTNGKGELEIVYSSIHGLPELALSGVGVGAISVHHITEDRLEGKGLFEDEAEKILELLLDSTVVAHNAGFEDRFLSANVPGYIEAKAAGRITLLDTRKVSKYLMPRSTDNTLRSFAEDNGVPYSGAHRAAADAKMMMQALVRLQRTLHKGGRFITRRASATARMNADDAAEISELER